MQPDNKEIERRIHRSACFQRVFKGPDGEFVLKEIDEQTHYKGNTFAPDPYLHAYYAGQRSMAVFIHNILEADVEKARERLNAADSER